QMCYGDISKSSIGLSVLIDGPFDLSRLKEAINIIVKQNEAMRLVLHCSGDVPSQRILPEIDVSLPVIDFSGVAQADSAALAYIEQEFQKPFQLEDSILFSFQVIRVSVARSYWLHRYHRLVTDSAGVRSIYNAVVSTYNQLLSGRIKIDSPIPSYRRSVAEEMEYLVSERFQRDRKFWQSKFSALPTPLFPESSTSGSSSTPMPNGEIVWRFEHHLFNQVKEYVRAAGCTIQHFMLALVSCYFARVSGKTDIVIGVHITNRRSAIRKKAVGMFSSI